MTFSAARSFINAPGDGAPEDRERLGARLPVDDERAGQEVEGLTLVNVQFALIRVSNEELHVPFFLPMAPVKRAT